MGTRVILLFACIFLAVHIVNCQNTLSQGFEEDVIKGFDLYKYLMSSIGQLKSSNQIDDFISALKLTLSRTMGLN
ncbi:unnamed protein product [Tenebrio molitor]|nr:unnamed protein product [Tenebrio molitor]